VNKWLTSTQIDALKTIDQLDNGVLIINYVKPLEDKQKEEPMTTAKRVVDNLGDWPEKMTKYVNELNREVEELKQLLHDVIKQYVNLFNSSFYGITKEDVEKRAEQIFKEKYLGGGTEDWKMSLKDMAWVATVKSTNEYGREMQLKYRSKAFTQLVQERQYNQWVEETK